MLLTQLEYFVAVSREEHFGRAAAACFISASALSEAIRKLETELGVPLVRRGRAYEGLTPEGEAVLVWARRMIADHRALKDEVQSALGRMTGVVRVGVIPSGVSLAARLLAEVCAVHPELRVRLISGMTSEQVVAGLRSFELDAGLLHPAAVADDIRHILVETDRLVVVGASKGAAIGDRIELADLASRDVCVLEPGMRARQILDEAMAGVGVRLRPVVEADSVEALLALARTGDWVSVVPRSAVPTDAASIGVKMAEIANPEVRMPIVLATLSEEPRPPLSLAVDAAAQRLAGRKK
ncbi:LysR family transcriptional regulator [Microbacterium sp. LMC-P-041]|uniref:LysR family transcriptional regulator n=1 Tax=Microbacterium sp. LMC-P-041 TaxID=3040293 RepID=UPI0025560A7A|nr:LysR family transcriptional regulator [Microbacterium sp. LMC-P-041]